MEYWLESEVGEFEGVGSGCWDDELMMFYVSEAAMIALYFLSLSLSFDFLGSFIFAAEVTGTV